MMDRLIVFGLYALVLSPANMDGHGRINSTVAADVREDGVTVRIDMASIDLIVIGDLNFEAVANLSAEERTVLLSPHLKTAAGRFALIDGKDRLLEPEAVRIDDEEDRGAGVFPRGLEQQRMTVVLDYAFPSPPSSLVFWQSFGEGRIPDLFPTDHYHSPHDAHGVYDAHPGAVPIYTALTVRRKGELALLPSELGPGFPVRFPFSWDEEFVPLAHRSSLREAAPSWETRPASARIEVEDTRVVWRLYFPLEALVRAGVAAPADVRDPEKLSDGLRKPAQLAIDGELRAPDTVEARVHPMSAMALLHNRTLPPESDRPGVVVLDLEWGLSAPPAKIDAKWNLYRKALPRLYCEMVDAGGPSGPLVLTVDSPWLRWQAGGGGVKRN